MRDDSWKTSDWLCLGALPLATVAVALADEDVREFAQTHRSGGLDLALRGFKPLGDNLGVGGAAVLWWAGSGDRAPRLAVASRNALESWLLVNIGIQGVKYSVGRARPWLEEGAHSFSGPTLDDSRHAFSSGHVGTSWAILGAYAMEYEDIPWVSWPLWATAAAVSANRLNDDEHWLSDVFFSAALATLSNRAIRAWNAQPAITLVALPTPSGWTTTLMTTF